MRSDNEVTELLGKLRSGALSLDQVADRFRHRHWPRKRRPEVSSYEELARRAQEDPEPYTPGSFDDVLLAYDRKELTLEQYDRLSKAVAEAKRAEDRGEL